MEIIGLLLQSGGIKDKDLGKALSAAAGEKVI
jgi:hypothetical protein